MSGGDFDFEPVRGLPENLPPGEKLLWQGAPQWRALARRAFHTRVIAMYFLLLVGWRLAEGLAAGHSAADIALGCAWLMLLGSTVVGMALLLAWLSARGAVYSITDKRVVLRHGIALPITVNVPFSVIQNVAIKTYPDGTGDLALSLVEGQRLGYLLNWPHVRAWHVSRPESTLRTLAGSAQVAQLLLGALRAYVAANPAAGEEIAPRASAAPRAPRLSGADLAADHGVAA